LGERTIRIADGSEVADARAELPGFATGADGGLSLAGAWPAGVPSGTTLVLQMWLVDAGGPQGVSATTAVRATAP